MGTSLNPDCLQQSKRVTNPATLAVQLQMFSDFCRQLQELNAGSEMLPRWPVAAILSNGHEELCDGYAQEFVWFGRHPMERCAELGVQQLDR